MFCYFHCDPLQSAFLTSSTTNPCSPCNKCLLQQNQNEMHRALLPYPAVSHQLECSQMAVLCSNWCVIRFVTPWETAQQRDVNGAHKPCHPSSHPQISDSHWNSVPLGRNYGTHLGVVKSTHHKGSRISFLLLGKSTEPSQDSQALSLHAVHDSSSQRSTVSTVATQIRRTINTHFTTKTKTGKPWFLFSGRTQVHPARSDDPISPTDFAI